MAGANPQRPEIIDIPERPTLSTSRPYRSDMENSSGWSKRRRILVAGGVAATGLAVALVALLLSGSHRGSVNPSEAPLIKAEDRPFKVTPESPGGMEVPNRDIMVYGRLQGTPGGKPPVERLLPEPEQPLTPPPPKPRAEVTAHEEPMPPPMGEEEPEADSAPAPVLIEPPVSRPVPAPSVVSTPDQLSTDKAAADKAAAEKAAAEKVARQKAAAQKAAAEKAAAQKAAQQKAAAEKLARAEPASIPAATGAYQVQLFSGRSADDAKGAWAQLKGKNGDLLASLSPSYARADLGDRGTFYRLRAGPLSEARAKALCQSLSGRGTPCIIVRPGN